MEESDVGPGLSCTLEEFERWPDDGNRYDLVRGGVVKEPPAGGWHGEIGLELARVVANFVRENRLGRVFMAETGFVLSEDPPTVRGPDLAFVATGRLPAGPSPAGFPRLAPDLAVEIVSPSNTWADVAAKIRDYLEAGTRLVWIVDPRSRTVTAHTPGAPPLVLGADEDLSGGAVLPGFRIRIRDLFQLG
jgi:Uma2 family endonuclease